MDEINYNSNPLIKLCYPLKTHYPMIGRILLTFNNFNEPLIYLPINITHLTSGLKYEHSIDNLPHT